MIRIIRLPEVKMLTGLGRSSILLYQRQGRFPPMVKIGDRGVGWFFDEIEAYNRSRISELPEEGIRALVQRLVARRKSAA